MLKFLMRRFMARIFKLARHSFEGICLLAKSSLCFRLGLDFRAFVREWTICSKPDRKEHTWVNDCKLIPRHAYI